MLDTVVQWLVVLGGKGKYLLFTQAFLGHLLTPAAASITKNIRKKGRCQTVKN